MEKVQRTWIIISGIMGFLAVAIGAFGAHGLEGKLSGKMMEVYRTGVLYHLIHAAVLLAVSFYDAERFASAAWCFLAGIFLFSFSLYTYSLTGVKLFAIITPAGGVSFLIGWALIIIGAIKA